MIAVAFGVCALALSIAIAMALPAVAPAADDETPGGDEATLRVGWPRDPDNLNPFIGFLTESYEIYRLNYNMLTGFDAATMTPKPELATEWSTSDDGLVWTFALRDDVTWQDGEPFTAADVVFTYKYIIDNELANFTSYPQFIDDVVAVDDVTVEFRCSRPKANMLGLWVPIVPRHIWEGVPAEEAETSFMNEPPIIGTGPFQVVEWQKDNFVRLEANKDYWAGAPKVDQVIFETFKNVDTMVQQLRNGSLAAAVDIPAAQFRGLEKEPGIDTVPFVQKGFAELAINCYESPDSKGHPALRDAAFRTALQYAIDREAIVEIAWNGYAEPATSELPSGLYQEPLDYHWDPPAGEAYVFDPERARKALDAAGYTDDDGDGVREHDGEPIELSLLALSNDQHATRTGKLLAGWLKDVGIAVAFETTDEGSIVDKMWAVDGDVPAPDFDLVLFSPWTGDMDPNWIMSIFTSEQIGNWSQSYWSDEEYDRLYVEQMSELDPQKRKELFWRLQEILYQESPVIFLVYPKMLEAYNTADWEGWVQSPAETGGVVFTSDVIDSYLYVQPKATVEAAGTNMGAIVGAIVGGLVVVGIIIWLVLRRRTPRSVEE